MIYPLRTRLRRSSFISRMTVSRKALAYCLQLFLIIPFLAAYLQNFGPSAGMLSSILFLDRRRKKTTFGEFFSMSSCWWKFPALNEQKCKFVTKMIINSGNIFISVLILLIDVTGRLVPGGSSTVQYEFASLFISFETSLSGPISSYLPVIWCESNRVSQNTVSS